MVDVNTIKPGDKVVVPAPPNGGCTVVCDGVIMAISVDTVFEVADPPVDKATRCLRLSSDKFPRGFFIIAPTYCDATDRRGLMFDLGDEPAEPKSCSCDIVVLLSKGCQCGAMQRERDAT